MQTEKLRQLSDRELDDLIKQNEELGESVRQRFKLLVERKVSGDTPFRGEWDTVDADRKTFLARYDAVRTEYEWRNKCE